MPEVMLNTIAIEPNRFKRDSSCAIHLESVLPDIKKTGFNSLEIWQYHIDGKNEKDLFSLKSKADNYGIKFKVLGAYPVLHLSGYEAEKEVQHLEKLTDNAKLLGVEIIKFFFGKIKGSVITEEELANTCKNLSAWQGIADKNNIKLCAELHNNTLFDPVDAGEKFLSDNPDLKIGICFQPYDFTDTEKAICLAERFSGKIIHTHLQGRRKNGDFVLLEDSEIYYGKLIRLISKQNRDADFAIEFVKDCAKPPEEFNLKQVLENARTDADFARKNIIK